jgi:tetratricopeptide (TPR) repeat protein
MGRLQEAGEMAEGIVADLGSPPVLLVLAALIMMRTSAPDVAVPADVLKRVIEICNMALTRPGASLQNAHISMINSTIGYACAELGDVEKAREYYEEAVRQSSDDPAAFLYLGRICYNTAPERAVEYLQKATQLNPNLGLAHKILAHYFLQNGKPGSAIIESTEAIRCSPNDHEKAIILAWRAIGTIRAGGATSDARKDLAEAMRIGPDIPEILQYHKEFLDFERKIQRGEKKQGTALLTNGKLFSNAAELVSDSVYRSQITAGTPSRLAAMFCEAEPAAMLAN